MNERDQKAPSRFRAQDLDARTPGGDRRLSARPHASGNTQMAGGRWAQNLRVLPLALFVLVCVAAAALQQRVHSRTASGQPENGEAGYIAGGNGHGRPDVFYGAGDRAAGFARLETRPGCQGEIGNAGTIAAEI